MLVLLIQYACVSVCLRVCVCVCLQWPLHTYVCTEKPSCTLFCWPQLFIFQLCLFIIYLFIYSWFGHGTWVSCLWSKNCCTCFTKLLHGEGLPWVDFHCCCDANRMGCLVIVVLVAVVITGPVVPVRFSASYRGSACLCWGAAPLCKCTPLCFLWYSPVYSGPPRRCTVRLPTWPFNQGSRFKSSWPFVHVSVTFSNISRLLLTVIFRKPLSLFIPNHLWFYASFFVV